MGHIVDGKNYDISAFPLRNQLTRNRKKQCDDDGPNRALSMLHSFRLLHSTRRNSIPRPPSRWVPLLGEDAKMNIDAGWKNNANCVGLGVILRENSGFVLAATAKKIQRVGSAPVAEALATKEGSKFVLETVVPILILEGDSAQVLKTLAADITGLDEFSLIIRIVNVF